MVKVGIAAGEHLVKLRASITDEKTLLKAFMRHDENGDGYLQQEEFDSLMLSLGMELNRDELDAIFFQIDVDNDKNIVYDEFRSWWKQTTSEARVTLS
jgi:Ca2+-binding EF-hand superfamily protein